MRSDMAGSRLGALAARIANPGTKRGTALRLPRPHGEFGVFPVREFWHSVAAHRLTEVLPFVRRIAERFTPSQDAFTNIKIT